MQCIYYVISYFLHILIASFFTVQIEVRCFISVSVDLPLTTLCIRCIDDYSSIFGITVYIDVQGSKCPDEFTTSLSFTFAGNI